MIPPYKFEFPPSSRYHSTETATIRDRKGKEIRYLKRRFVPDPNDFSTLYRHYVEEGDRLDNITARYLGDPEQYWRICDANYAMKPWELTAETGSSIDITLPEGIPEIPNVAG